MASSLPFKFWSPIICLLCLATLSCKAEPDEVAEPDAIDIIARALTCFNDQYVYKSCQESYRLKAEGQINVPPQAADEYCGGPCLIETKLLLDCIDNILYNFKFYNGASIQDVKYTLNTGCGHTDRRGDFNVQEHKGEYGDYYYYDQAIKLSIPTYLTLLISAMALAY